MTQSHRPVDAKRQGDDWLYGRESDNGCGEKLAAGHPPPDDVAARLTPTARGTLPSTPHPAGTSIPSLYRDGHAGAIVAPSAGICTGTGGDAA